MLESVKNWIRTGLLLIGATIASFSNISIADDFNGGSLKISSRVSDPNFMTNSHYTKHLINGTEGYDAYDLQNNPLPPYGKIAKIVSIIPKDSNDFYELIIDARPLESLTPVNLELTLHEIGAQRGTPINVSDLENWLEVQIDIGDYVWDFYPKPITLWQRNIIDPNENPNDPNNYSLSLMADIREATGKTNYFPDGKPTVRIPLPNLNGTNESEDTYMWPQTSYCRFAGDFNLDGRVDNTDLSYLGQEWGSTNGSFLTDISGGFGQPDGNVDDHDLGLFTRDWLRDSNDTSTWWYL